MRKLLLALLCLGVSRVGAQSTDIFAGRPAFDENAPAAYYVWHEGNAWHVRWNMFNCVRYFSGSVVADGGALGDLRRVDPLKASREMYPSHVTVPYLLATTASLLERQPDQSYGANIQMKGKSAIDFNSPADDNSGGFDFRVGDDVQTLAIELKVEGKPANGIVWVGKDSFMPASTPIIIPLKR